ncbi:hypothetical protein EDB95_3119 [Dinghuibacter silviterrae]|uniref:Uncharacterized protein n=1 Tax=Dinghuibacter silviterrae TaxID=1539049 RepID=A0A4R8DUK8_9BACT|nr:hypothetical protein EDB95_3119 [Dinghuibacter silviterrae]
MLCCLHCVGALGGDFRWARDTTILVRDTVGPPDSATVFVLSYSRGSCKTSICTMDSYPTHYSPIEPEKNPPVTVIAMKTKTLHRYPHGDFTYDYSLHSSPDTSYPGSSFVQHQVTANVSTTLLDKYPVLFHAGVFQTNIPYINNYIDANVQFDRRTYGSSLLNQEENRILGRIRGDEQKDSLLYASSVSRYNSNQSLYGWLNSDKQVQQLISSANVLKQDSLQGDSAANGALAQLRGMTPNMPSASVAQALSAPAVPKPGLQDTSKLNSPDTSAVQNAIAFIQEYDGKLSAWQKSLKSQDSLQHQFDSSRNALQARKDSVDKLSNAGDLNGLKKMYPDSSKGGGSWLLGIRQASIGRSSVNYTELSAKNISVLGVNVEYCRHYYAAFAAGKIDFRYLDFLTGTSSPNQYVILGRFGVGEPEHKHLYFTVYTGTKQTSYVNTSGAPDVNHLTGITLEGRFPIDRNTYVTAEVAKSSYPQYIATGAASGKMLSFGDRANEAYSLQFFSYIPWSDTHIYGMYNRMGVYFQCFNLFNNNANTSTWQARVDQYFWRKRVVVNASVKRDDYSTPFVVNNYDSKSVFYSLQASLRLPKLPVFTAGFLPCSQLTSVNGQLVENRFYTLMGSATYAYKLRSLLMTSSLVYTRYFNSSNQAGFLFYDAQSWFFNQTILLHNLTLSGSATLTKSPGYTLLSAGPGVQWRISPVISAGGGIKYNSLNGTPEPLGYNGNVSWQMKRLGRLALSYERGYLPSPSGRLFQNDWGRATYTKTF